MARAMGISSHIQHNSRIPLPVLADNKKKKKRSISIVSGKAEAKKGKRKERKGKERKKRKERKERNLGGCCVVWGKKTVRYFFNRVLNFVGITKS